MKLPDIKGFIDVSLVDWDGRVSAVMFLPYCNFRCPFCYNAAFVLRPEEIQTIPYEEVERYLAKKKQWLDGVVITGGEPTVHDELPCLCRQIKELGLGVKLDTNGTNSSMVQELISLEFVDYVAMDVKAPLTEDKYSKAVGVEAENLFVEVEKTVRVLLDSSLDYEFRTTLVPAIHGKTDITQICSRLRGCKKYVLQTFRGNVDTLDPRFKSVESFSPREMEEFLTVARKTVPNTLLR